MRLKTSGGWNGLTWGQTLSTDSPSMSRILSRKQKTSSWPLARTTVKRIWEPCTARGSVGIHQSQSFSTRRFPIVWGWHFTLKWTLWQMCPQPLSVAQCYQGSTLKPTYMWLLSDPKVFFLSIAYCTAIFVRQTTCTAIFVLHSHNGMVLTFGTNRII